MYYLLKIMVYLNVLLKGNTGGTKLKRITFCFIFLLLMYNTTSYAEPLPQIDTKAAILVDVSSGQILFTKDSEEQLYPASTTKIMTAILAIEKGDPKQMMSASSEAVHDIGPDGMHVGIKPGDEYSLEILLNALLVRSANETANIIAENICLDRQEFINLMNSRAKELGCQNTNFLNTNGMHNDGHYSSALDLSIMARHALTLPMFREIVSQKYYNMPVAGKPEETVYLQSTNELLKATSECFSRITGIKTGYTNPAGFNVVASAIDDSGLELLTVVMGAKTRDDSFTFAKKLLEYGYNNFKVQSITRPSQPVSTVNVLHASDNPELLLVTEKEVKALMPLNQNLPNIEKQVVIDSPVQAPVQLGDVFGYVIYKSGDIELGRTNIIASRSIGLSTPAEITQNVVKTVVESDSYPYMKWFLISISAIAVFGIFYLVIKLFVRRSVRRTRYRW